MRPDLGFEWSMGRAFEKLISVENRPLEEIVKDVFVVHNEKVG